MISVVVADGIETSIASKGVGTRKITSSSRRQAAKKRLLVGQLFASSSIQHGVCLLSSADEGIAAMLAFLFVGLEGQSKRG